MSKEGEALAVLRPYMEDIESSADVWEENKELELREESVLLSIIWFEVLVLMCEEQMV